MTPDETTRVQEIRTRVEATTIGDWTAQRWAGATIRGFVAYCGENENQRVYVTPTSGNSGVWQPGGAVTDAEFIANAKQDVPFLLSLVERQAAEECARFAAQGLNISTIEEACEAIERLSCMARTEVVRRIAAEWANKDGQCQRCGSFGLPCPCNETPTGPDPYRDPLPGQLLRRGAIPEI